MICIKLKTMISVLALSVAVLLPLAAQQTPQAEGAAIYEPLLVEDFGYRLDPPSGWLLTDAEEMRLLSFANPAGTAVVQVLAYEDREFDDPEAMLEMLTEQLGAEVIGDTGFSYAGRDSILADMSFAAGPQSVRGYALLINDPLYPVIALGYIQENEYEIYHDFIVSFLDSLSLDGSGDGLPGPMSQFVNPFLPGKRGMSPESIPFSLELLGTEQEIMIDPLQADASQVVIDREARLLTAYAGDKAPRELQEIAWERFFRMIYRDAYARLTPVADAWRSAVRETELDREELPAKVLTWLQGYEYDRRGGVSDFLNPIDTMYKNEGDCDSLVLLYATVLDQLGFDTIMMVSTVHGHALAGVDTPGAGARFPFAEREWLVAELTAPVDLGLIEQSMADPADWMGFIFQRLY
ncbi:MAG: hypothetical protein ACOCVC_07325 [Spirochaeta sp.]